MLQVTIELIPGGFEPMRRVIGTMHISNMSNLVDLCDYAVSATEGANPAAGIPASITESVVLGHDRRQRVWAVIQRACEEIMKADWVEL
jgi:hypothetical protein